MQNKHKLLKLLSIVVDTILVFEEPKLILAGSIIINKDRGDIKSDGNFLSSGWIF